METDQVPAYLRPVLLGDRGTPAWYEVLRKARRLQRYPLDIAERLGALELVHGHGNPRDVCAAVWLVQHPEAWQEVAS